MRRIDADALCEEFKRRQRAALRWKEEAILADNEESKIRADAVLAFLSEVKLTIDNAPTVAQPTGEWIDVSERLPDKDGKYLLWGIVTEDEEGYYSFVGSFDSGCEKFGDWEELYDSVTLACVDSEFFEYYEVIAWMPLPKPYK